MENAGTGNASVSAIHAVKYWPEPVGYHEVFADRSRDPYNQNYQERHGKTKENSLDENFFESESHLSTFLL